MIFHDLGRATVNRLYLRIEIGPGDWVFAHVAVPTVQLQTAVAFRYTYFRWCILLGHGACSAVNFPARCSLTNSVDHAHPQWPRLPALGLRIGCSEATDRPAERLALLAYCRSAPARIPSPRHMMAIEIHSCGRLLHQVMNPIPLLPSRFFGWNRHVGEDSSAIPGVRNSDLVQLAAAFESAALPDDQQTEPCAPWDPSANDH